MRLQVVGILTGMTGFTDNYAHMGGALAGILWGFATITTVSACDKCTLGERMATTAPFSWCVPKKTQERLLEKAKARSMFSSVAQCGRAMLHKCTVVRPWYFYHQFFLAWELGPVFVASALCVCAPVEGRRTRSRPFIQSRVCRRAL